MRARELALCVAPPLVVGVLLFASAPPWPDDWDGLGFLESISRFDMDHFAPHPPGYPVYVALLRLAALLFHDPMRAAIAVSALGGVVVFVCARAMTARFGGLRAALFGAAIIGSPLAWRALTAVGSEAPALAFLAIACWAARRRHVTAAAVAVGLGLGVRLSWAPAYLALVLLVSPAARVRWLALVTASATLWVVPLLLVVGPSHLWLLYTTHFSGHAARWGGTALTDPHLASRLWLLARDVFVDGLGAGGDLIGISLVVLLVALSVLASRYKAEIKVIALVCIPYAMWIFVGQNLGEQPRHALPLVVALVATLGVSAVRMPRPMIAAPVLALMLARTAMDSVARHSIPPAGVQLVAFMAGRPDDVVFGGASVRFFARTSLADRAKQAETRGDIEIALARLDRLPRHALMTDEIDGAAGAQVIASLCRPERIDRKRACLRISELPIDQPSR